VTIYELLSELNLKYYILKFRLIYYWLSVLQKEFNYLCVFVFRFTFFSATWFSIFIFLLL